MSIQSGLSRSYIVTENVCSRGPGAYLSDECKVLTYSGTLSEYWRGYAKVGCVHMDAQRVLYLGVVPVTKC